VRLAFHQQSVDGTPLLNPLWAFYPSDANTLAIDTQFFYGSDILVSPVIDEDSTSVTFYLPKDQFYDFYTLATVTGSGSAMTLSNVNFTTIPLHIRGGSIIPLRAESANTTAALRKNDFSIVVAPGSDGTASGSLYFDDGVSLTQAATSEISFSYGKGALAMSGSFGYNVGNVGVSSVKFLGLTSKPSSVSVNGRAVGGNDSSFDAGSGVLMVTCALPLTAGFTITLGSGGY